MAKAPEPFLIAMIVLFFGGNGVWLAHRLLWQRSPKLFWLASATIAIGLAFIVATGAAMSIARSLWPLAFDEPRSREIILRLECGGAGPRMFITGLIMAPIMLALFFWLLNEKRFWRKALAGVGFVLLYHLILSSPIPGTLEPLILPDAKSKLAARCDQESVPAPLKYEPIPYL